MTVNDAEGQFLLSPSEGGKARARKLTPEQRTAIAQRAARARWDSTIPTIEYSGALLIGETRIECAVLDDGTRVLAQGTVMEALGRARSMGRRGDDAEKRAPFLSANNLEPFISERLLAELAPIEYRRAGDRFISVGYKAETLPAICEVYLEARARGKLLPSQENAARAAEILVRSLAQVGIIALVDEATGYQEARARDDLQRLLHQFVSEEFRPWVSTFPDAFFREMHRLYGWDFKPGNTKRSQYAGKFINTYVYDQLPEGVLPRLQEVNPVRENGGRVRKHHQHLSTDTGSPHLDRQILTVTTLMQVSNDIDEFKELFERRFPQKVAKKSLRLQIDDADTVVTLFELDDLNDVEEAPQP